jgi:mercuric ion binding protein
MKNVILSVAIIVTLVFTSCKSETKKGTKTDAIEVTKDRTLTEVSFGVRGNCGMCKSTIEKAANGVKSVTSAIWDVSQKKIVVSFDASKIAVAEIHKAIAASGYDTEALVGSDEAYNSLPGCCKYDHEMVMNVPETK